MAANFAGSVEIHGFATVPDVLSSFEIYRLASELDQASVTRSRAGIRHAMKCPAVAAIARDPRLYDLARAVLGRKAFPYRATLFDKSPDINWLVVWHQDTAIPLRARHERADWGPCSVKEGVLYAHAPAHALSQVLALRLHLDDSNFANGPLRVLPETHVKGVLSADSIQDLAKSHAAVECIVPQGGILAMRPLLVHASSKSRAQQPRRVLHIEYATAPMLDGLSLAIA